MFRKYLVALILLVAAARLTYSQTIVNAYAKVTGVSGTTLTVSNENYTHDAITVGEEIIVMQMQDDIIGANTGNDASFGDISSIASTGLFEVSTVASISTNGVVEDIWNENFDDLTNGDISDAGVTMWSRNCNSGTDCYTGGSTFQVDNTDAISVLSFSGLNLGNNIATLTSETLDISSYSNVSISADLKEIDYDANADFVRLQYRLDGGSWTTILNSRNNFGTSSPSLTGLNGSTLRIRVRVRNNGGTKRGIFDNLLVRGTYTGTNSITVESALTNTYNTGTNSSVQIISYPEYASYTTTDNLTAIAWDGNVGGVVAMRVTGTLNLGHNISVNEQGFRGGAANTTQNAGGCDESIYRTNDDAEYARKGEGVYKSTDANYNAGRAKIINGGGGGSHHNAGGGGGGNFTAGGDGGPGYNGSNGGCSPTAGGVGGLDLSDHIGADRLVLGGGGGGGQQNNSNSEAGGLGGGIILLKANTISTTGGCGGLSITSNGQSRSDSGADGGAGAGAGGSILLNVITWDLNCKLTVSTNGGSGGSVSNANTHGGGGGGGKGVIVFSGAAPSTNFCTENNEGSGGLNGSGGGNGNAPSGGSSPSSGSADPDGIIPSQPNPLPVNLLYWKGNREYDFVKLNWATATEIDNDYFTIERSNNGLDWHLLTTISGNGNSSSKIDYEYLDYHKTSGLIYYRLSQTDFDGTKEVFNKIAIDSDWNMSNLLLMPNPNDGYFSIQIPDYHQDLQLDIRMHDLSGQLINFRRFDEDGYVKIDVTDKQSGLYLLSIISGNQVNTFRIKVR